MHLFSMKQILLLLFSAIAFSTFAQTKGNGKLYGYKQAVAAGIVRKQVQEDGTETVPTPRQGANYYIYLVTSARAYPSELWVNGKLYSASVQSITKTPVEHTNNSIPAEPDTTTLVPKTNQNVIQLTPRPAVNGKAGTKGKSLAGSNELVVVYKQNGRFYYQTLAKLSKLNAAAMQ